MSRRIVIIARCTNTLTYLLISCRASVSHTSARCTRVVAVVGVRAVASALTTTSNLNMSLSVLPPTRRLQSTNVATAGVTILTNVETSTTTYHAADAGVTRHLPPPRTFPPPGHLRYTLVFRKIVFVVLHIQDQHIDKNCR